MADAIATASASSQLICRYPKRKRAAVSYHEADSLDDDLFDSDDEEIDKEFGARPNKKRKTAVREPRQKPFRLLSLPPELRNKIYQEALGGLDGIFIRKVRRGARRSCTGTSEAESGTPLVTNLLATSQTVYAEAAALLYGQRFRFEDNRALLTFLSLQRPATVTRLRDVAVREWNTGRSLACMNVPAMALLSHAGAGLRRLRVETQLIGGRYYSYRSRSRGKCQPPQVLLARKVFRDCYPLLYAVQAQRGPAAVFDVVCLADKNFASHSGPGDRQWPEPADVQAPSVSDKMAFRRRLFQKELGKLLGWDAAEVEAIGEASDAPVCA